MIVITVIDDNRGMMFNNRRQSQDCILREQILALVGDGKLWMNQYTYGQFLDCESGAIAVDDAFLEKAGAGEYCFVENILMAPYEKHIEKIVLFRWNRKYPADFYFDIELEGSGWRMTEVGEFSGFSHKKIIKEIYVHE